MSVPVGFEPIETWLLEERRRSLLDVVRFGTDRVVVTGSGGKALLWSTEAPGTYGHVAVLHRCDSLAGISTVADARGVATLEDGDRRFARASSTTPRRGPTASGRPWSRTGW